MPARLVQVAVPVPGLPPLTYRVPGHLPLPLSGARVVVPMGPRTLTGWVVGEAGSSGETGSIPTFQSTDKIRELLEVIDAEPLLPPEIVTLALWTAEYYAAGPGEALAAAMPPQSAVFSRRVACLTAIGEANELQHGARRAIVEQLREQKAIAVDALVKRSGDPRTFKGALDGLVRDGLVRIEQPLAGRRDAFRSVARVRLTALAEDAEARKGKRQAELIDVLRGAPDGLTARDLAARGIGWDVAKRLAALGLAQIDQVRLDRDPFEHAALSAEQPAPGTGHAAPRSLTAEQSEAVARLGAMLALRAFGVAVLHGVTGSGKTEVYLRLAAQTLAQDRRVLILVPEIALTPAAARIFRAAFGDRVAIQHSALSDGERHDQWHRIRRGEVDVVVGTRSAVFAPLPGTGLIVVDEEHDGSFKQDESPRYHGRDVAIVRARNAGALIVLGSATPALETYEHARQGKYTLVTLARRVMDRPLARVQIVPMQEEFAERGADIVLSRTLEAALVEHTARGEQAVVLLNRRGFATLMFCRQCGHSLECPNCSLSLTIHRGTRRARCHYCNHAMPLPKTCPACKGEFMEQSGFGTERVEAEIRALLPDARIARVDRDTVRRRGAIAGVLTAMAARKIDVLVGTQMIAKGHDFPAVTLVGVVSADVGLGMPDFRAGERTFQLLTQVSGRAGRGDRPGLAIVQTLHPEHYSIQYACMQDYAGFFENEMIFRRAMRYPPAASLINIVAKGPSEGDAMDLAADLARRVRAQQSGDLRVLGPAPAPLARIKGEHRAQFFIKGTARTRMREVLLAAIAARADARRRISVDIDPLSVL
ncbi:MAG: primosomal protein N' [Acidobacteriota bacterium]|nr:primosomal protein N' [Acidobacteriota bacterium]